jgi:SET and MYND domain-containing protein
VHKLECPALCKIRESVKSENWFVPTPVRAAMQLLLRLNAGDERALEAVGGVPFVTAQDRQGVLQGNVLGFSRDDQVWKDLGMQAMAALKFSGIELDGDRLAAAAEGTRAILCMLQTNAFDRRDKDVGAAGVFLDVDLAMANHSCVPNAYVCFVGRTAALRAEREIKVGEEIVISYIGKSTSWVIF